MEQVIIVRAVNVYKEVGSHIVYSCYSPIKTEERISSRLKDTSISETQI